MAVAATAASPCLHLAARRRLHEWLCNSGSAAAWRLLVHCVGAARQAGAAAAAAAGEHAAGEQVSLPLRLLALYPLEALSLARLLHLQPPSGPGLVAAAVLLRQLDTGDVVGGGQLACGALREHAWRLLLDCPCWLRCALQHLPEARAPAPSSAAEGEASAAEAYVGFLLWPLHPEHRPERSGGGDEGGGARCWQAQLDAWEALWADEADWWPRLPAVGSFGKST